MSDTLQVESAAGWATQATVAHDGDRSRVRSAQLDTLQSIFGGEPIAMGGPLAMKTRDELGRAEADFNADVF